MIDYTDWFDGSVKPHHVGVYERDYGHSVSCSPDFCFWDGHRWMAPCLTTSDAMNSPVPSKWQHKPWRGLMWLD